VVYSSQVEEYENINNNDNIKTKENKEEKEENGKLNSQEMMSVYLQSLLHSPKERRIKRRNKLYFIPSSQDIRRYEKEDKMKMKEKKRKRKERNRNMNNCINEVNNEKRDVDDDDNDDDYMDIDDEEEDKKDLKEWLKRMRNVEEAEEGKIEYNEEEEEEDNNNDDDDKEKREEEEKGEEKKKENMNFLERVENIEKKNNKIIELNIKKPMYSEFNYHDGYVNNFNLKFKNSELTKNVDDGNNYNDSNDNYKYILNTNFIDGDKEKKKAVNNVVYFGNKRIDLKLGSSQKGNILQNSENDNSKPYNSVISTSLLLKNNNKYSILKQRMKKQ
jgi:hypothetical protein